MNETHFQINTRENRRWNQEWRIQRHLQCWTHFTIKTQDEDNQKQKQNTIQSKKYEKHGSHQIPVLKLWFLNGLFLREFVWYDI